MAISTRSREAPPRKARARPGPSVREVCLLGPGRPLTAPPAGSGVQLYGRSYRVASLGECPAEGAPPRYVYLAPDADRP